MPAVAHAETFTLERKVLKDEGRSFQLGPELLYRLTSPQHFWMQTGVEMPPSDPPFSSVIKKQPAKYACKHPFRCVAKLGTDNYGFVLDGTSLDSKGYDRLYFDRNHNGDLTDDAVIKARPTSFLMGSRQREFPRVDVTVNAGGKKLDYAFFLSVYTYSYSVSDKESQMHASASLTAGVYREGDVTVGGKKHHVSLIDFNSNGRFDDKCDTMKDVQSRDDQVHVQQGDSILIDPDPKDMTSFGYSPTDCKSRHHVSKLVNIDDRFYELTISPSGDSLTLTPSKLPIAYVSNPGHKYDALIYGDNGFLKISGGESKPAAVPVGEYKLLGYRIEGDPKKVTSAAKAEKTAADEEKKDKPEKPSLGSRLGSLLFGGGSGGLRMGPRVTFVNAQATKDYPSVKVREGKTTLLAFGPPYKPVVEVQYFGGEEARLGMKLVGSAGETCSNLMVDGDRPPSPTFQITTTKGEIVARGKFEFG
jgi:hypothetical protein